MSHRQWPTCATPAHGPRLPLYLVPVDGHTIDTAAVREHLIATLTAGMVPDSLIVLDALPLAPTGKIDRAALPEPASTRRGITERLNNDRGRLVAGLFAEVTDGDRVGADDDFFELGGNSLSRPRWWRRVGAAPGRGAGAGVVRGTDGGGLAARAERTR